MDIISEINSFLQQGRTPKVKELVNQALQEGISAERILNEGLLDAMSVVGDKFKRNEVFVPEVLVSARAMNAGVEILRPYLTEEGVSTKGKAIIGTIKGDLHDIGKNIVKMMLEGKGIEVIDLGVDVPAEKFVEAVKEHAPNLVCCSALLTTTMSEIKTVVTELEKAGLRDTVKIMVGGAPVTQAFCDSVGADYYTLDAASASEVALKVCLGEL